MTTEEKEELLELRRPMVSCAYFCGDPGVIIGEGAKNE
jgi:hypothetical protein